MFYRFSDFVFNTHSLRYVAERYIKKNPSVHLEYRLTSNSMLTMMNYLNNGEPDSTKCLKSYMKRVFGQKLCFNPRFKKLKMNNILFRFREIKADDGTVAGVVDVDVFYLDKESYYDSRLKTKKVIHILNKKDSSFWTSIHFINNHLLGHYVLEKCPNDYIRNTFSSQITESFAIED